jgi:uncharacterized protein YndB with AHSA1/START domain
MNDYVVVDSTDTVHIERLLPGPIERVWSYLTDSDKRGSWLAAGDMELRVGGRVQFTFRNSTLTDNDDPPPAKYAEHANESHMHGRVIACEPPRLLSYTWGEASGEASEVSFELTAQGDKVRLRVTHSHLPNRGYMVGVSGGWHTHLGVLADRLEGRASTGFWRTFTRLEAEYEQRIPAA